MKSDESFHKKNKRKSESKKTNELKLKLSFESSKVKSSISPRKSIKNKINKNFGEIHSKKNRRSSVHLGKDKNELDLSNIKLSDYKLSFSPRKKFNNKDINISIKNDPHFNKKKFIKKHSFELFQTKKRKFYQKYNFKENAENLIKNKNIKNEIKPSQLNAIENNIKYALTNMIIKLEKTQTKTSEKGFLSPTIKRNKMLSSPELKFVFTKNKVRHSKKKQNLQSSLFIKETNFPSFSFLKK